MTSCGAYRAQANLARAVWRAPPSHEPIGARVAGHTRTEANGYHRITAAIGLSPNRTDSRIRNVSDLSLYPELSDLSPYPLQNVRTRILLPREVTVSWSADGSTWSTSMVLTHQVPSTREGAFTRSFTAQAPVDLDARYLRVAARGGVLPPAHPGAGGAAWVFIDELVVRGRGDR